MHGCKHVGREKHFQQEEQQDSTKEADEDSVLHTHHLLDPWPNLLLHLFPTMHTEQQCTVLCNAPGQM